MLEVKTLGTFEILQNGRQLSITTRNAQSLFAFLILNAGKSYRREQLAGLLWPDSSEENARSNLRHELWRLRKVIDTAGENFFLVDDMSIAFNPRSNYQLDVSILEKAPLEDSLSDDLIAALSVYHGELLPGFYQEWVFIERNRLQALFEAKMRRLLELLQEDGRWSEVLDWGIRWISVEEWSEPAYRALITAYANSGDLSKAAATYERLSKGLLKNLGVKPSEQSQALYKRLKAGWKTEPDKVSNSRASRGLKSAAKPNLLNSPLPRLRSSYLPRPLTSFIGRETEIRQIQHLVATSRLVTITGSGGVGKSRLAIQAARLLESLFQNGAWWVELAPLIEPTPVSPHDLPSEHGLPLQSHPNIPTAAHPTATGSELVAQAVAKILRVAETPGLTSLEGVLDFLHDKELLLVMDNCEHLIEACASLVERLLSDCPNVVILSTSREALGLPGEKAWLLPSLSVPDPIRSADLNAILQAEAVKLFIDRASDVQPGYRASEADGFAIAQICQRLGGIPLAIELAAARMNLLSAHEIADRLDSRFSLLTGGHRTNLPRHRTLQAAIEWSYDLLNDVEKILFRRLSIFAVNFTLEAAEAVCNSEEIRADEVLTILGKLVNKSLLQVEPTSQIRSLATRYRFLDTICSFGRLKLAEAGETRWMRDRHAAYYACLAEKAEPELILQEQVRWFERLQAENDNLRAVIEWAAESDQAEHALRMVGALMWFWFSNGSSREGRDLTLKALSIPSAVQHIEFRAKALNTAGLMQCYLGDVDAARNSLEEALSILKTLEDETSLAWTLQILGVVFAYDGKYDLAAEAFQDGLAISNKLGGIRTNNFLHFLGDIELQKGNPIKAKMIYEESANILRSMGSKSFLAYPLRRLGYMALKQADLLTAKAYFLDSLALNREVNDKRAIAACLISIAALAMRLDKPMIAARLHGMVNKILDTHSLYLHYIDQAELENLDSQLLATLDAETMKNAYTQGWEMSEEEAFRLVEETF